MDQGSDQLDQMRESMGEGEGGRGGFEDGWGIGSQVREIRDGTDTGAKSLELDGGGDQEEVTIQNLILDLACDILAFFDNFVGCGLNLSVELGEENQVERNWKLVNRIVQAFDDGHEGCIFCNV